MGSTGVKTTKSREKVNAKDLEVETLPRTREDTGGEGLKPLNRELSWLKFNERVLEMAKDERTPLLERVRFLSIFSSNLDEFIMKRVGGLKRQVGADVNSASPDGLTPRQQLKAIRAMLLPLLKAQYECFSQQIHPALTQYGIQLLSWDDLTAEERGRANTYFHGSLFPLLTPLAVDPGHPFPFISNLSTSLGVMLRHPDREESLFARIKAPSMLRLWVRIDDESKPGVWRFVRQDDIIRCNLDKLFPGMVILDVMAFRVTRNSEPDRDEEDAEDLLEMVAEELRARRFAEVVRLEHGSNPQPWILKFLQDELELEEDDLYERPGILDYSGLDVIANLDRPELKFAPWSPLTPVAMGDEETDLFSLIRSGDILVHHPYEHFSTTVERFVTQAADDPYVMSIKMTVYRTSNESLFAQALIRAAQAGKLVVCLVELQARFDEERNIRCAQRLEKAGVHVVYGVVGLKTHNKTVLVVRQEPDGLRCYAHVGTGNYNSQTARLYTDFGLFTCDPEMTNDLIEVFHFLTGRSLKRDYKKLLVAPVNMRERFIQLIRAQIEHQQAGRKGRVIAKMNSLEDSQIIQALYAASNAGVQIDLIVRGFCCLRPGVKGFSENIRVISVVGRFLEHSRIFFFQNGQPDPLEGAFYIGSADWMYRNLQSRVESVAPVESRKLRERLWETLDALLKDRRQAWDMQSDGNYTQRIPPTEGVGPEAMGTHAYLMNLARERQARYP